MKRIDIPKSGSNLDMDQAHLIDVILWSIDILVQGNLTDIQTESAGSLYSICEYMLAHFN